MMVKKKIQITNKSIDFNNLNDNHLSIQLSLDGFSFCIINKDLNQVVAINNYSFSNNSPTPEKHLENITQVFKTEKILQKKYHSVNVTHVNDLSTLVPKPLFDSKKLKNYIKYNSKIYKNDYIVYDIIENHNIVNVYIPFVNINNFILEKFGSFEYKHSSAILVENLLNTYKHSQRSRMFANICQNYFEIVVIANNKLLFYNSFDYKTKEDFIYYILFTAEQLQLNPEKFELALSGKVTKEDDFYQIAYKYVRNVSLLENRSKYTFSEDFSGEIKRRFLTLLNQY